MSKRLMSTVLLLLIGVGFGIFSVVSLANATTLENRLIALLYLIPALAALGALIMLPFRAAP